MKNNLLLLVPLKHINRGIGIGGEVQKIKIEIKEHELEEFIVDAEEEIKRIKADAEAYLTDALEAQASKLLIEITARCKETTESLVEEVKKEVITKLLQDIENYINESGNDFGLENIEVARKYHNIQDAIEEMQE